MEKLAEDIWVHEDELRLAGVTLRLRMTVVRLVTGQLWVHSPTAISDELIRQTSQLGDVGYIVGANNAHHLFLMEWASAFPSAQLIVSSGIPRKLKLKDGYERLDADFKNVWEEDLGWTYLPGFGFFDESMFLHKKSRSLILTDYIQNHEGAKQTFMQRFVLGPLGFRGICLAPPLKLGFLCKDKVGYREALQRVKQWQFERIVVTHGDVIEDDAMTIFEWLSNRFM